MFWLNVLPWTSRRPCEVDTHTGIGFARALTKSRERSSALRCVYYYRLRKRKQQKQSASSEQRHTKVIRTPLPSQEEYWKMCKEALRPVKGAITKRRKFPTKRQTDFFRIQAEAYRQTLSWLDNKFPWRKIRVFQTYENDAKNRIKATLSEVSMLFRGELILKRKYLTSWLKLFEDILVDYDRGRKLFYAQFDNYVDTSHQWRDIQAPVPASRTGNKTQKRRMQRVNSSTHWKCQI